MSCKLCGARHCQYEAEHEEVRALMVANPDQVDEQRIAAYLQRCSALPAPYVVDPDPVHFRQRLSEEDVARFTIHDCVERGHAR